MRIQAALEPARRHRRVHEVVQERQEPPEVGNVFTGGVFCGGATRPRKCFLMILRKKDDLGEDRDILQKM
jgi:hypothetical protein